MSQWQTPGREENTKRALYKPGREDESGDSARRRAPHASPHLPTLINALEAWLAGCLLTCLRCHNRGGF